MCVLENTITLLEKSYGNSLHDVIKYLLKVVVNWLHYAYSKSIVDCSAAEFKEVNTYHIGNYGFLSFLQNFRNFFQGK